MSARPNPPDRRYSVAPMMDWTDRHCRFFHRLLSQRALLYTEMVTTGAILFGDAQRFLRFNAEEQPVALQLGGSDPSDLAKAAKIGRDYGYAEINLNVGCPSDRVQSGNFGAALMAEPQRVADCFKAMADAVDVPVTIKCRIGIDDQDEDRDLDIFVNLVKNADCKTFIVHARKAWLKGLSPKENRHIPPLNYARVERLKRDHSELELILNGGLDSHEQCMAQTNKFDGFMIGRWAYSDPWSLSKVDQLYFGQKPASAPPCREQILLAMADYAEKTMLDGVPLASITKHMLGLYNGQPGARAFRRHLTLGSMRKNNPSADLIRRALDLRKPETVREDNSPLQAHG